MLLFGPPSGPLQLTAVQVFVGLTVLFVILENAILVRNRRRGMGSTNVTCGEPPSTLGDLVLYTQQQNEAFYVCTGASAYATVPLICPILTCQANGTFSTLAAADFQSHCFPFDTSQTVVNASGEITSPGYPGNYVPALQNLTAAWTIMSPGANLVIRVEDFDIDSNTFFKLLCGYSSTTFNEANETTLPGTEFNCNGSCALLTMLVQSSSGGRGFNFTFRTQ